MSWEGNYFGPDGVVAQQKSRFTSSEKKNSDHIAIASAYYSAANRIFADVLNLQVSGLKRVFLGIYLAFRAVHHIDAVDQKWRQADAEEVFGRNAEQTDVCCAIYLRYGWLEGGRLPTVRSFLRLQKPLMDNLAAHTHAFILLHRLAAGADKPSSEILQEIMELAELAEEEGELAQASRIYRQLAKWCERHSKERAYAFKRAEICAKAAGATDQLVKLGV